MADQSKPVLLLHKSHESPTSDKFQGLFQQLSRHFRFRYVKELPADACIPGKLTIALHLVHEDDMLPFASVRDKTMRRVAQRASMFKLNRVLYRYSTSLGIAEMSHAAAQYAIPSVIHYREDTCAVQVVRCFARLLTREREEQAAEQLSILHAQVASQETQLSIAAQLGMDPRETDAVLDCLGSLVHVARAAEDPQSLLDHTPLPAERVRQLHELFATAPEQVLLALEAAEVVESTVVQVPRSTGTEQGDVMDMTTVFAGAETTQVYEAARDAAREAPSMRFVPPSPPSFASGALVKREETAPATADLSASLPRQTAASGPAMAAPGPVVSAAGVGQSSREPPVGSTVPATATAAPPRSSFPPLADMPLPSFATITGARRQPPPLSGSTLPTQQRQQPPLWQPPPPPTSAPSTSFAAFAPPLAPQRHGATSLTTSTPAVVGTPFAPPDPPTQFAGPRWQHAAGGYTATASAPRFSAEAGASFPAHPPFRTSSAAQQSGFPVGFAPPFTPTSSSPAASTYGYSSACSSDASTFHASAYPSSAYPADFGTVREQSAPGHQWTLSGNFHPQLPQHQAQHRPHQQQYHTQQHPPSPFPYPYAQQTPWHGAPATPASRQPHSHITMPPPPRSSHPRPY